MLIYVARRLALALVTCVAISVLTFIIIRLPPGDFVDAYIANLAVERQLGLGGAGCRDAPRIWARPAGADPIRAVDGARPHGDFGVSMMWRRPVTEVIGDRLWLTMAVSIAALFLTWIIALPIGIYSAARQYSIGDYVATTARLHRPRDAEFPAGADPDVSRRSAISGSASADCSRPTTRRRLELGQILGSHGPPPAAGLRAGAGRHRAADPHHARQPARRTAQALRRHRAGQGYRRTPRGAEISGARRAQSLRQLERLSVSRIWCPGSIVVSLVLGLPTVGPLLLQALVAQDMFLAGTIVLLLGVLTVIGTLISDLLLMWVEPRIRLQGRA